MPERSKNRELAFTIKDVARLLRTLADQKAREFGMTQAKWAVLARLDRSEGLKQNELAEMLDLQPITLTRLLDSLCDSGLIERRADPTDRRANRLYLTPTAQPLLQRLNHLGEDVMGTVLAGLKREDVDTLLLMLGTMRDNIRQGIQRKSSTVEQRYG